MDSKYNEKKEINGKIVDKFNIKGRNYDYITYLLSIVFVLVFLHSHIILHKFPPLTETVTYILIILSPKVFQHKEKIISLIK